MDNYVEINWDDAFCLLQLKRQTSEKDLEAYRKIKLTTTTGHNMQCSAVPILILQNGIQSRFYNDVQNDHQVSSISNQC